MDSGESQDGSSGSESNDEVDHGTADTRDMSNSSNSLSSSESRVQTALSQEFPDNYHFKEKSPDHSLEKLNYSEENIQEDEDYHPLSESLDSQENTHQSLFEYSKHSTDIQQNSSEGPVTQDSPTGDQQMLDQTSLTDWSLANKNFSESHKSIEGKVLEDNHNQRRNRSRSTSLSSEDNSYIHSESSRNHIPKLIGCTKHLSQTIASDSTEATKTHDSHAEGNANKYSYDSSPKKTRRISRDQISDDDNEEGDVDNLSVHSGSSSASRSLSSRGSNKSTTSRETRSLYSRASAMSSTRKKSNSSISSCTSTDTDHKKCDQSSITNAEEISDGKCFKSF